MRIDLRRNGVDVHLGECGSREDNPRRRDRDQPVRLELGDVGTDRRRHPDRHWNHSPAAAGTTPPGAIKTASGLTSIPASSVAATDRLVIDSVKFTPGRLTSRAAFSGRFHVAEANGYVVRDALVKVTPLPYAWAKGGAEVRTDQDGWATLSINPTINMPLTKNALVMFVRARVEGQSLLTGSSTRRLVQVTIRR